MRNVVRAIARRDHTIGGMLLRRPFAAASSKAMPKVIDSTAVMETAATATAATAIAAAFSAVSLAGLESAKTGLTSNAATHLAAFFFLDHVRGHMDRIV